MNPYSSITLLYVKSTSLILACLVISLLGIGIVGTGASAADSYGTLSPTPLNTASVLLITLALTFAIAMAMLVLRFDLGLRRLKLAEHRYRSIITQLEESILIADASTRSIIEVNPALHRLLGYSMKDLEYLTVGDIFLGSIPEIGGELGNSVRQELRMRARDGRLIEAEVSMSLLSMDERNVLCLVARDITARREIERQVFENQIKLSHLAHHDSLTGMPNRLYLQAHFPELIDAAQKAGKRVGLIYIDVDNFKNINDSYGHGRGDQLLLAIAERLRDALRGEDLIVRMGGDEFVVVTVVPTVGHVEHLAERVLDSLRQQFRIEGGTFEVTTSSGVSVYPDHGGDLEMLLKHADIALYQAKDNGRNKLLFYSSEMNLRLNERLMLEQALRKALGTDELYLEYQPLVDLNTGVLVGFEALVRWKHPQMIPPSRFIPVAEQCGLISDLGEHVLRVACRQMAIWQNAGLTMVPVSINVSPKQFQGNRLVNLVESLTAEHKIRPSMLSFEITETALMETTESYLKSLQTLRELGARISIDDFGTGYSSLSYLKHLPIDALKIDRAFVRDMATDPNDAAIVSAIVSMSRSLGLYTVAEGIETPDQLMRLRDLGCQNGQGFYFSRPVPVEQCHALLEQLASHRRFVETGKIRALRPAVRREF